MIDTARLVRLLRRRFERPETVYMTGASMGGHITARSIEQFPRLSDGAMPICGVLGDYELFDWFLDYNLGAQQIGLGESDFPQEDAASYIGRDVPAIKANLEASPGSWPQALNTDGEDFKQLAKLRSGGDRPNFDEAWVYWNSIPSDSGDGNFLFVSAWVTAPWRTGGARCRTTAGCGIRSISTRPSAPRSAGSTPRSSGCVARRGCAGRVD